ncbi:hypothetical protein BX265_0576 [Streptomyces sp. TLI_235]|nr:hypothetical protein [Streptomyces sp. TLI_235]PBC75887.1 hypothetical protein BX265_0576 [Streptomyces sp. TLI_235]
MKTGRLGGRWLPLVVLVAALSAVVASLVWAAGGTGDSPWWSGPGPMTGAAPAGAPVRSLADADRAVERFAAPRNLHAGEVMQFSNGYYAELLDPAGRRATEVLVDPGNGTVRLEFGPAMMWNTVYGMMPAPARVTTVGPERAVGIADRWLARHRAGEHAGEADDFPGYYTLHTLDGTGRIMGMLSVDAATGQVWYHTWHNTFLRMQEHPGHG